MFKQLKETINRFGLETQQKKLAEEMLEFQLAVQELALSTLKDKTKLREHVAEEMGDVLNLIEQIRLHFDIPTEVVNNYRVFKANRQHYREEDEQR